MNSAIDFESAQLLIGGRWCSAASGRALMLENPSSGSDLASIARGAAADVDAAVRAARAALEGEWGCLTATERGRVLSNIGQAVAAQADELAQLEALDVGKPLKQGRADALALARYLEFYGGACDKVHGETLPYLAGYTVLTLREPHGVTAHIVPWNYPMQIVGRSVGAALAMGNACVLKPAEEACLTVLAFARIAQQAGLPAGALNVVTGTGEEAGAALSAHPGIDHISFTGSVATGALVQAAAAWIRRPTITEPVNDRCATPLWAASAAPASSPRPGTTLTAPAGRPASRASWANASAVRQASSAGFSTQALPIASAAPTERLMICIG
jgi:aldehyde dehydrogenase (NAD+)